MPLTVSAKTSSKVSEPGRVHCVFKPTLRQGFRPILQKIIGSKEMKMIYDSGCRRGEKRAGGEQRIARASPCARTTFSRSRAGPASLKSTTAPNAARHADGHRMGQGRNHGELFIVQARPETVQSRKDANVLELYQLEDRGKLLLTGRSVGAKIAHGPVRVINDPLLLDRFQEGEVLVAEKTDPDWEPVMKKAAAIITDRGGLPATRRSSVASSACQRLSGRSDGTGSLKDGQVVTVSCAGGDTGLIYEGRLPFGVTRTDLKEIGRPRTQVMMNVANPEGAFALSFIPNDGVGLAREEFIITSYIKAHPLALLDYAKIRRRCEFAPNSTS